MEKVKDWVIDHIEGCLYTLVFIEVLGFGYICYKLGTLDC